MTRIRLAAAALAFSCLAAPAPASAADDFETVSDRYAKLISIVRTSRMRLTADDRPAVEALLADVSALSAAPPNDARVLAMEIQLMQWLEREPAEIDERYTRLERLRPEDMALLESANAFRLTNDLVTEAEVQTSYLDLADRLPGNDDAMRLWTTAMNTFGRYSDVTARLDSTVDAASTAPQLVTTYLDAVVNLGRYDDVIAATDVLDGRLETASFVERGASSQLRRVAEEGLEAWATEEARRAADAADLPRVRLTTPHGPIVIELYEDDAPNTVANFITLVRDGFYNGLAFHQRVLNSHIVGGDPNSREGATGARGTGGPGHTIADETTDNARPHLHDTVAMHRPSGADSAGSMFYFSFRPIRSPIMRGNTVFGRVIEGLDAARRLQPDDRILTAEVIRARDHDYTPEITPDAGATEPAETDLPTIPELPPAPPLGESGTDDADGEGSVGGIN